MARKKKGAPLLTNAAGKPMDRWTPTDWDAFFLERITNYEGESYLVDDLMGAHGWSAQRAQREITDPATLIVYFEEDSLPAILADRTACKALKDAAILKPNVDVIEALIAATKKLRVRKKPGPKGKMVEGRYQYAHIERLKDEERLTFAKIARQLWGDPTQAHRAKVQYMQSKRRLLAARRTKGGERPKPK